MKNTTLLALCLVAQTAVADGPKVNGWIDTSVAGTVGQDGSVTPGLDEVEVNIQSADGGGAFYRADIQLHPFDGVLTADGVVEQGYVGAVLHRGTDTRLSFGKFNAPLGWELLDAVDMFQYSHALAFNYGIPTNVTGLLLTSQLHKKVKVSAYAVNGWDQVVDINNDITFGGRLDLTVTPTIAVGLSSIYGNETDANDGPETLVIDVDATIKLGKKLLLGLDFNRGATGDVEAWMGAYATVAYSINEKTGTTFRYDWFSDEHGTRLGDAGTRQMFALSPNYKVAKNLLFLLEVNHQIDDSEVFVGADGSTSSSATSVAAEMTMTF